MVGKQVPHIVEMRVHAQGRDETLLRVIVISDALVGNARITQRFRIVGADFLHFFKT